MSTTGPTVDDVAPTSRRTGPHAPLPTGVAPPPAAAPTPRPSAQYAEEDPRTRAARRTAELMEHGSLDDDRGDDPFYIDPRIVPDGWSYEYKRHQVFGKEDASYQVSLMRQGWEPVPARRHAELMPMGNAGMTIERDGMILMERPLEVTQAAQAREYRKARSQVGDKEAALAGAPQGQFDRSNKGSPLVNIKKSYEPMPAIPKE